MPLINCPDCRKQISDLAAACPDCGYPIHQARFGQAAVLPTTTVELTDKKWKKLRLWAAALILGSLIGAALGGIYLGIPLFIAGTCCAVYAGFGSWWHHG